MHFAPPFAQDKLVRVVRAGQDRVRQPRLAQVDVAQRRHLELSVVDFVRHGGVGKQAVVDAPNDDAVAKLVLQLGMAGNVRTKTLKAFTEDQYRGQAQLPGQHRAYLWGG